MRLRLVVHRLPPQRDVHWGTIAKAKTKWADELFILARAKVGRGGSFAASEHRWVKVTFYRPGPVSDLDNAFSRLKVPLDAMVRCGLLVDDKPKWCTVSVETVPSRQTYTVIEVTDEPPPMEQLF